MNRKEASKKALLFWPLKTIFILFLMGGFALPMPALAQMSADFVPPDTHILARLKGTWSFHYETPEQDGQPAAPTLRFEEGDNLIEITLVHTMDDFLNNDEPIAARNYFKVSISDFYFDCNGGDVILWFDNGDSAETSQASCTNDQVQATMLVAGAMPDDEKAAERKFAQEIAHYRPIAISQGQYSLMLDGEDNGSWKRFTRANNPQTNPGYFESVKKYFLTPKSEAPV
ncbi:hypothetical protein FAI41_04560 [Acetobacteraceae bacterium]|nr:hypothetical protein FAI41_04560 [Acetobacteraceae bacterium]